MIFIGNEKARNLLKAFANAKQIPHFLIVGPYGHGKTSLVRMVCSNLVEINANMLKDHNDLLAVLRNPFVFIDEIHSLSNGLQEALYSALDSYIFPRISGRGKDKIVENIKLNPFTLAAATTKENKLTDPLKNRFLTIHLQPYSLPDLFEIAKQAVPEKIAYIFAQHARNTPRTVIKLCQAFRSLNLSTKRHALSLLEHLNIYQEGLTATELRILKILEHDPMSLTSISAKLMLDEDVVEEEHEPFLIKKEFIIKNKNGRAITQKGLTYLNQFRLPKFQAV